MRGYLLLGQIASLVQPPVLYCTGKISKTLISFQYALLSKFYQDVARSRIFSVLNRTSMGSIYLREFARLTAHIVADEQVLDVPLDGAVMLLLHLSQVLAASWRRAIGTSPEHVQECAVGTLQLGSALLGFLYISLKPCDPGTRASGVYNLYVHTAMPTSGQLWGKRSRRLALCATIILKAALRTLIASPIRGPTTCPAGSR